MTAFAMDLITPDMSIRAAVLAIGQALHAHMTFDSGATDVLTPPAEAFANARGVCQDFSHILIACLRGVGIPAGYVSGFLRTAPPPGQPRLEGADAMHAWVRAWCGAEMGWIDYDPTNDMTVGDDHIAVAVGRDYADVSPVRGTLRSIGGHVTGHSVDVVPHGPPQDTPLP
jgi:transglutaminase-like putative cysteine protease